MSRIKIIAEKERENILTHFYGNIQYSGIALAKLQYHELNASLLLCIENLSELHQFLNCSTFQLEQLINNPSYIHYTIPKKKGGTREIFAPEEKLKAVQKRLNYFLQAYYLCIKPAEVHGFTISPHYLGKHCNIVANAHVHTNKKSVLNIDLANFFPSISEKDVKAIFSSNLFNFDKQTCDVLTQLTTFEGILPIGAPTSPVISNFVCRQVDIDLKEFCDDNKIVFTRYADDLTFSSNESISKDTILDIIALIEKNNFKINEKKLRLATSNRKQTVTGITVNEKVNIDRKLYRKIRAMLHDLNKNGLIAASKNHFKINGDIDTKMMNKFLNHLEGLINFVGQVRGREDLQYIRFKENLNKSSRIQETPVNSIA